MLISTFCRDAGARNKKTEKDGALRPFWKKKLSLELSKGWKGLKKDIKAQKTAFDMHSIIEACKFLAIFYYGPLNISVGLFTHISIFIMNHYILVHDKDSGQVN